MYSRQEASKMRQLFWTTFGQYMAPVLSAEGEKINWINYKTGEKNISFRMEADTKTAVIAIELSHPDTEIQHIYFQQFEYFKKLLHALLAEKWTWQQQMYDSNGRLVSRIFTLVNDVNILHKEDWPAIISFFKPRIRALDEFWSQVKYGFETLR